MGHGKNPSADDYITPLALILVEFEPHALVLAKLMTLELQLAWPAKPTSFLARLFVLPLLGRLQDLAGEGYRLASLEEPGVPGRDSGS